MKGMKWATGILSALMVLFAYGGGYWSAAKALEITLPADKLSGMFMTAAAMMAVAAAWTSAKADRARRVVAIGVAAALVPLLGVMGMAALGAKDPSMILGAMRNTLLILALLLAIIWLVGGMIRRNLTERE